MAKKQKAVWGWVFTGVPAELTDSDKKKLEVDFQDVVSSLKDNGCLEESAENDAKYQLYAIDIFLKWHKHFLYVFCKRKDNREGRISPEPYREYGIVRIECMQGYKFKLAYFRHTGKWEPLPMYDHSDIEVCKKAIKEEPWFQVF